MNVYRVQMTHGLQLWVADNLTTAGNLAFDKWSEDAMQANDDAQGRYDSAVEDAQSVHDELEDETEFVAPENSYVAVPDDRDYFDAVTFVAVKLVGELENG